ncbi:uncharacterized protein LOC115221677 isoform X1 [Octopus sinensis]|uniref:Uncharacterized protein LOC115221677 isoform X1 n=2 Tax=Octopus sinensis TaxID=2607531 RepID=A0A6P7T9R4_9MOLL|nr:uncharacterized protein LOC115221677 isoform X1 [Octopus sinensis]
MTMFTREETDLTTTVDITVSLARYATSMLGNPDCIKCIVCDSKHVFARDIAVVLQNIDTKHPITQVISGCCEEYHGKFGCGTKSLLYFIGQWMQIGTELLRQGISIYLITSALRSTIENCIQYVDTLTYSVDKFLEPSSHKTPFVRSSQIDQPENSSSLPNVLQPTTNFSVLSLTEHTSDVSWFFQDTATKSVLESLEEPTELNNSDPEFHEHLNKINLENNIINSDKPEKKVFSPNDDDDDDFSHCFDQISSFRDVTKHSIKETQFFTKHSSVYSPIPSNSNNCSTSHTTTASSARENWLENYVEDYIKSKLQKSRIPESFPHLRFSQHLNPLSSSKICSVNYDSATNAVNTKLCDEFKEILILDESEKNSSPSRLENFHDINFTDIWQKVKGLVQAFCHGAHTEIEDFVIEALKYQNKHLSYQEKNIRLDVKRLHTCCIQGPTIKQSEFVPGIVLPLQQETFCIEQDKTYTVLLLNGDVSYNNHHVGYKKLAEVKEECLYEEFISKAASKKDRWLEQVQWLIKKLDITILIARGKVDEELKAMLDGDHILVFDNVAHTTMRTLAYNTEPVVYILDATLENTISGVTVKILNSVLQKNTKTFLILWSNQSEVQQTLILCHATCAGLDVLEQEFWLCCHRVSSVLSHSKFLAGQGMTELWIAEYLEAKSDALKQQYSGTSNIEDLYQAEIISKLADSFRNYQVRVQLNSGLPNSEILSEAHCRGSPLSKYHILDDFHSKIHGWKRAIQLVCILLHTDAHIILC